LRKVNSANAALQFENASLKAQMEELRRKERAQVVRL